MRYTILVPTDAGLLQVHVRVNVPQEGPRASGKLVRWSRVQTGELAMEAAGGHRLLSFQVEGQVLKGADVDADEIAAFALHLFAAIDGRAPAPPLARGLEVRVRATAFEAGPCASDAQTAAAAAAAVRGLNWTGR